jgi:hypothetical protein
MLLGSRGFALGEHGSIGSERKILFSERLHLPWLLYECGNTIPIPRVSGLSQPADVGATLFDWFGVEATPNISDGLSLAPQLRGKQSELRELAVAKGIDGERAVRTLEWLLRSLPPIDDSAEETLQLYAKPDDRWESNDVAIRCEKEVEALRKLLNNFTQQCHSNEPLPRRLS